MNRNGQLMAPKIDMFPRERKNNGLGSSHPSASALSALGSTHLENLPVEHCRLCMDTTRYCYYKPSKPETTIYWHVFKISHWNSNIYPVEGQTPKSASEIQSWHGFWLAWKGKAEACTVSCFQRHLGYVLWWNDIIFGFLAAEGGSFVGLWLCLKQVWLEESQKNQTTLHQESDGSAELFRI